MTITRINQVCKGCGLKEEYKYNQEFFVGGPGEVTIEYDACLKCCEAEDPEFSSIEEALVAMISGGRGLPTLQRKWFAENTPLPLIDSDDEAMAVADELAQLRGYRWARL